MTATKTAPRTNGKAPAKAAPSNGAAPKTDGPASLKTRVETLETEVATLKHQIKSLLATMLQQQLAPQVQARVHADIMSQLDDAAVSQLLQGPQ